MSAHQEPSVEVLRRESERSRAALTITVGELCAKVSDTADDLKTRLSPAHIKEEVKDYVREGSEQIFHSIERKVRENPLQAVAIGAGLAYPLWGFVKAVPVPFMLIGAGLWLTSRQAGRDGNTFGSDPEARAADAGVEGADRVVESAQNAKAAVSAGLSSVGDTVRAAVHDARDSVANVSEAVAGSVADNARTATQSVADAASDFGGRALEMGTQSRNALVDLVERNPLLVAGASLAIGAFIAASLPASDAEDRMFGETSDDLKGKAREAAANTVERAKDAVAGMVGDVTAAAAREGLSAEGLGEAVEGLTEGARAVVDRGMKTALGETGQSPGSSQPNKS